jgi:hypothetical protein
VEPLRPTPPSTGSQTVPPPNQYRRVEPVQMADDDFG